MAKFLRELKRGGYTTKNGDVTSTVRQWKNTRHPDHIPITITFVNEDVRIQAAEAATELELMGSRTPREGDQEFDRIGYVRKSLTERERKDRRIRREKRDSPEGVVFAEIRRREEISHADADDWAGFQLEEEDGGPVYGYPGGPINDFPGGAVPHEPNNNAATAMEEMMHKMQELQENYDRLKANQEAATAARETEDESDFELTPIETYAMGLIKRELIEEEQEKNGQEHPPICTEGFFQLLPSIFRLKVYREMLGPFGDKAAVPSTFLLSENDLKT